MKMAKMKIEETQWFNVKEKLPIKFLRVKIRCGELELIAHRIGLFNDYWVYDSGFVNRIVEYDYWRPV